MMSPYLMNPLRLGVDIVYDSATKYLSGHHELMAGVIACDRDDIAKQLFYFINSVGNALDPMGSSMLLRGSKTLAVRIEKQQASAMRIATYLHQLGFRVHYPGLRTDPGHKTHMAQARGAGAVMSFETGNIDLSAHVVAAARIFGVSVSFGCVNSLISMPTRMSCVYASERRLTAATRASTRKCAPSAGCRRTSSGCALASRTRMTSCTISSKRC